MKNFTFLILGIYFCTSLTLAQESQEEKQPSFISSFLKENAATEDEKLNIQCELILVHSQYQEANKSEGPALTSAFDAILRTYRATDSLDKSHRLHELSNNSTSIERTIDELYFFPSSEKNKHIKPILGEGYYEKSTSCINSDFETGNYDNWSLAYATSGGQGGLNPGVDLGPMNGTTGNHAIMGPGAGMDGPSGGNVERVYPGGGEYSFRIGDQGINYNASRASYTFTVTPATELFLYHFAVILEDDGHKSSQQPFMKINLIVDGVDVPCGYYHQAASGSAPGYSSNGKVRYKPWETVSIALTDYMGQTATIQMITADCSQGGHFGYAYVDAECMAMPNLNGATINCQNPTVVLEGPPGATAYVWTGPGIVGANNTKDVTVNAGGTYSVKVIPVQGEACSYTLETIVTDEFGIVNADFNAIPDEICLGEKITFEDNTTMDNFAGVLATSNWDFGDGNSSSATEPIHTYAAPGIYTIELAVESSNNCTDVISKDVRVSPIPVADFNIDSVCMETNSTLQDLSDVLSTNGDHITIWNWDFGDGQTSTDENPTLIYGSENIYDVTLNVASNNGCTNSITKTTVIYPKPIIDFTPTEVCLNFENSFTDLSTVSNDFTTNSIIEWNWDFGDGSTSTDKSPRHTYNTDGTFQATLAIETNRGCTDEITKTVTVHPLPEVSFTGINLEGCAPICPEVTSTSTINSPSTIDKYEWTLSDGRTYDGPVLEDCYDNESGNSIIYGLTLKATSNEGCVTSLTESNYIEVYHNPIADFYYEPNNPSVIDSKVEFMNTSLYADVYEWTFGNQGLSTETNPIKEFTPEPIEHIITLVANTHKGCSDTIRTTVEVDDKIIFYIPNTFTPDDDHFNETFKPIFTHGYEPLSYTLYIFNRWGEIVFESHDTNTGWDGTYGTKNDQVIKEGTYIWKIVFKETMSDKRHTHSGHVNLLR